MAQHAQWWRVTQLEQRWQREPRQQHKRTNACQYYGHRPCVGQIGSDNIGENPGESFFRNVAYTTTDKHSQHSQHHELSHGNRDHKSLCCSKALHQRHRVHTPMCEAARRHRHGNCAEQQADHSSQ